MLEIRLSDEQERLIHQFTSALTKSEVEQGVEPSGYRLTIEIGNSAYGFPATVSIGDRSIDIGDVEVISS